MTITPFRDEATMPRSIPPRQRQVAVLITEGLNNEEIAEKLGISKGTVEAHRSELYARLGVHSAVELYREAMRLGWVQPPGPGRPRKEREPD